MREPHKWNPATIMDQQQPVDFPPVNAIDYYGMIENSDEIPMAVGDTVIFGFRIQAFLTRAFVVPLSGVSTQRPVVHGVFTPDGRKTNWPDW